MHPGMKKDKRKGLRMGNTRIKVLAFIASAAIAAMLGLAACDSGSSSSAGDGSGSANVSSAPVNEAASPASSDDSVSIAAVAADLFANCLLGQDDEGIIYFYAEDEAGESALLLTCDVENETLSVDMGKVENPAAGTIRINTAGAGAPVEFQVDATDGKTDVSYTFANGRTVSMGVIMDNDTLEFLQAVDELIADIDNSTEAA